VAGRALAWIAEVTGRSIENVQLIRLGSTSMHRVDFKAVAGLPRNLALRRYLDQERLAKDPWYKPSNEAAGLVLLHESDVHAPRLVAHNASGSRAGVPALLTTFIAGRPPIRPRSRGWIHQLACELFRIHAVRLPREDAVATYSRYYAAEDIVVPSWSRQPSLWERLIAESAAAPHDGPWGFIHRDYHPGNTLWSHGRLIGVVDWTTAARGPLEIDLARMRQNLAKELGDPWPELFVEDYRRLAGTRLSELRIWELVDIADSLPDMSPPMTPLHEERWARFEAHAGRVLRA
jgi:aminoglycoside phosphotransferase (APT) family kinase protein